MCDDSVVFDMVLYVPTKAVVVTCRLLQDVRSTHKGIVCRRSESRDYSGEYNFRISGSKTRHQPGNPSRRYLTRPPAEVPHS